MPCYCVDYIKSHTWLQLWNKDFTQFNVTDSKSGKQVADTNYYCKEMFAAKYGEQLLLVATSSIVVVINMIACTIFEKIVFIEKNHTVNDETIG